MMKKIDREEEATTYTYHHLLWFAHGIDSRIGHGVIHFFLKKSKCSWRKSMLIINLIEWRYHHGITRKWVHLFMHFRDHLSVFWGVISMDWRKMKEKKWMDQTITRFMGSLKLVINTQPTHTLTHSLTYSYFNTELTQSPSLCSFLFPHTSLAFYIGTLGGQSVNGSLVSLSHIHCHKLNSLTQCNAFVFVFVC